MSLHGYEAKSCRGRETTVVGSKADATCMVLRPFEEVPIAFSRVHPVCTLLRHSGGTGKRDDQHSMQAAFLELLA